MATFGGCRDMERLSGRSSVGSRVDVPLKLRRRSSFIGSISVSWAIRGKNAPRRPPGSTCWAALDELWRDLDQTEMRPIWEIVYFYERLWADVATGD